MDAAFIVDWLNLLLRWAHMIVGIAWIGASFYFIWLDNHLHKPLDPADIAKGIPGAIERDHRMARARKELDWEGQIEASLDPVRSRAWLEKSASAKEEGCTMCGDLCAVKMGRKKRDPEGR